MECTMTIAPESPSRRAWLGKATIGACSLLAAGCNWIDPCTAHWDSIHLGDAREAVLAKLGPPKQQRGIALPLMSGEEAVWESLSGKRCTIYFAVDRVVGKALATM
jgi:hypothetical protein